jgi:hypothetical protein
MADVIDSAAFVVVVVVEWVGERYCIHGVGVGIEAPCASLCIVARIDIGLRRSLWSSLV